ncbi:AAEL010775-PA [Aedes aegypti]|nr:AAEL010775-PA [Aedes aegypti]
MLGAVAVKINFFAEEHLEQDNEYHEHYSLYTMFMETLASFCQEGCEFINRSSPGRLSQMMLFVCSLVVFNYYSSGIFSILMQGPQKSNIKTLTQLADSRLQVGIDGTVDVEEFFMRSTHSDIQQLVEKKDLRENFNLDPAYGIYQVRSGTLAYHCDRMVAYNVIRDSYDFSEMCDLNEIEVMPPQGVGLLIRKDSPFRELLNIRLARLRETGAFSRFSNLWITKKPECLVTSVVSSVSMEGAFPIFLLLIAGTIAAFMAFALENGLFRASGRHFGSSASLE